MKKFLLSVIVLSMMVSSANSENLWRQEDTYRQIVLTGLICIDWLQTQEIVKNPKTMTETNPILGEHPTMRKANLYILGSIVGAFVLAKILPKHWRIGFQYIVIGTEITAIANNYNTGIRIQF